MLTIHGAPPSIHTRKVIVAALEKDLEYRVDVVFPFEPPAGWKELSPTGKIPVLSDAEFRLPDSSAIVAYLERRFPARPLYPDGDRDYARALWLEEYADSSIAPHVAALFHQRILQPLLFGKQPDKALMDHVVASQLAPGLDYIEGSLKGEFLAGGRFGIADITIASSLTMFHYLGYGLDPTRHARLAAHFERTQNRDSFRRALAAERPYVEKLGLVPHR